MSFASAAAAVEKGRWMDFVPAVIVFIFMGFQKGDKGWKEGGNGNWINLT